VQSFGSTEQVLAVTALVFVEVTTGFKCEALMDSSSNNPKKLQNYMNQVIKKANDDYLDDPCQTISVTPGCADMPNDNNLFSVEAIVAVADSETIDSVTAAHKEVAQARLDNTDDRLTLNAPGGDDPDRLIMLEGGGVSNYRDDDTSAAFRRVSGGRIRVEPAIVYVAEVTIEEIVEFIEARVDATVTSFIPETVLADAGTDLVFNPDACVPDEFGCCKVDDEDRQRRHLHRLRRDGESSTDLSSSANSGKGTGKGKKGGNVCYVGKVTKSKKQKKSKKSKDDKTPKEKKGKKKGKKGGIAFERIQKHRARFGAIVGTMCVVLVGFVGVTLYRKRVAQVAVWRKQAAESGQATMFTPLVAGDAIRPIFDGGSP